MPLFYRFLCALAAYCFVCSASAEPVAWGGLWQSLSSEHFEVHFEQAHEASARRALQIAEQVHQQFLPLFKQAPQRKTQLVIVDDYDLSNGWASPIPFNQIRLYLHAPDAVDGLEQMDDWWQGLIRHEYAHVLHLEMAQGTPQQARRWFGRLPIFFPHLLTPSMLIEGLAVYLESDAEVGFGRLNSSRFAAQMRAELLAHGGDSLNQAVLANRDWPTEKAYLYGAYFWQYLADTYGREAIFDYLHRYSYELFPYVFQQSVAKQVFGKSFKQLWADYQQWLVVKFASNKTHADPSFPQVLDKQQITATSSAGLWQVRANGQDRQQIQLWPTAESTKAERQVATKQALDMDVSAQGDIALTRLVPNKKGQAFSDLFVWRKGQGWQRLTHQQRFNKVRWLNGQQLLVSRQIAGRSELWLIDLNKTQQLLWQGEQEVLGSFTVHPNGQLIVASIKRALRDWDLEQFDLASKQWTALTDTHAIEHQPEFMDDGSLLFSADYQGVFNIYRMDLISQTLEQLTDVDTGAFQPRWLAGQLIYQRYTSEGFQLQHKPFEVLAQVELDEQSVGHHYAALQPAIEISAKRNYSPWPTVLPTYWMPWLESDEEATFFGLSTGGSDALGRHNYEVSASYNAKYSLTQGSLFYLYDNRWQLGWLRDHNFYNWLGDDKLDEPFVLARNKTFLARQHLLNAFEDQLQLQLGMSYEQLSVAYLPSSLRVTGKLPKEALVGAAISFNNQEHYRNVMQAGWGSQALLVYESFDVLDNHYAGYRLQGSWQQMFDLPGRSTLEFTLLGGYSNQTELPFEQGGSSVKDENTVFGRQQFSLPGYPRGSLVGNHYYQGLLGYRHWLARVERNLGLWPVGLGDISARAWGRTANAWEDERLSALASVGAELELELMLGYQMPVPLTLGVAQGLNKKVGETQAYLQLGLVF